jgi:hypothetical protein
MHIKRLMQRAIIKELRERKENPLPKINVSDDDLPGL